MQTIETQNAQHCSRSNECSLRTRGNQHLLRWAWLAAAQKIRGLIQTGLACMLALTHTDCSSFGHFIIDCLCSKFVYMSSFPHLTVGSLYTPLLFFSMPGIEDWEVVPNPGPAGWLQPSAKTQLGHQSFLLKRCKPHSQGFTAGKKF